MTQERPRGSPFLREKMTKSILLSILSLLISREMNRDENN